MKILKYKLYNKVNIGTAETPVWEDVFFDVEMGWNESNEMIAKQEAYNGEYTIEDDGVPEPVLEPTAEDLLNTMLGVSRYV